MVVRRHRTIEGLRTGEKILYPTEGRLFYSVDHDGYHGARSARASVIWARDEIHARELLDKSLTSVKLMPFARKRYLLREIPLDYWTALVLADGSM